jgi:hypothetical protein
MTASSTLHFWFQLMGSVAMLAVILTALGLMMGLVKLADIPRKLGTLLGIVILSTILPGFLISAWARMSMWQQIALAAFGVILLLMLRPPPKTRSKRKG